MKEITKAEYLNAQQIIAAYESNESLYTPHFWYMLDSFQFIQIKGNSLSEISADYIKCAKKYPQGMVCRVRLFLNDKEVKSIGREVHVDEKGNVDLKPWLESIINEPCIRKLK